MKKLLAMTLLLLAVSTVYAAFPREYPIYLGLLGFKKSEIERLRYGGSATHSIPDKLPGEYGISAARVFNVPVYYFRDYYSQIESYRTLFKFQQVGKFKANPDLQDLRPLRFSDSELQELLSCRNTACGLKLSSDEIARIPQSAVINTVQEKEAISDIYRSILLDRLIAFKSEGMKGLGKYNDGPVEQSPETVFSTHVKKFDHLEAYFPAISKYLVEYPEYKDKRMDDFFFWSREYHGNKPVITLRHVMSRRIGEDYILINHAIYSNHYFLSSIAVMHLIHYSDAVSPWTLFVLQQRTLTDLQGPLKGLGRNILRTNLERDVSREFHEVGKEMEVRYKSRSFANFPYTLYPRDQR